MEYNEQAAIDFIRTKLPADSREKFDDDEILNVIDIIWDFYDENGYLDIDADVDDDDELDCDQLMLYVKKVISKDRECPLTTADIEAIVNAELDYEDSIL